MEKSGFGIIKIGKDSFHRKLKISKILNYFEKKTSI